MPRGLQGLNSFYSREYFSLDESSKPEMECLDLPLILYIPLFRLMLISHLANIDLFLQFELRMPSHLTFNERTKSEIPKIPWNVSRTGDPVATANEWAYLALDPSLLVDKKERFF